MIDKGGKMYILIISVIIAFLAYLRYFPLGYDEDKHFEEIKNQKEVIKKSINDVEVAKNEYLLASKDSRALELLREKQETEYEKNLLKEEEKESDDTVIQRFCEENELLI